MSWKPYLSISNCDSDHKNCEADGMLPTIWEVMGDKYNFTTTYDTDPDGNWGTTLVKVRNFTNFKLNSTIFRINMKY